jgi:hypothetical protein
MNERRNRPNVIPWPPILIGGLIALGFILDIVFPLSFGFSGMRVTGGLVIMAALSIDLWAMKTLNDGSTTIMPHRGSSYLVTARPVPLLTKSDLCRQRHADGRAGAVFCQWMVAATGAGEWHTDSDSRNQA